MFNPFLYCVFLNACEATGLQKLANRILDEIKVKMLEDIVFMETAKKLNQKKYKVFKLKIAAGEFDMVIYDREKNVCGIYKIKHIVLTALIDFRASNMLGSVISVPFILHKRTGKVWAEET